MEYIQLLKGFELRKYESKIRMMFDKNKCSVRLNTELMESAPFGSGKFYR